MPDIKKIKKDEEELPIYTDRLKLPAERSEKVINEILSEKEQMRSEIEAVGLYEKWRQVRLFFENDLPEKTFPFEGCSNLNVPVVLDAVESIRRRLSIGLLFHRPIWSVEPGEEKDIKSCRKKEHLLDYEAEVEMPEFKVVENMVFLDTLQKGIGIAKLSWAYRKEILKDRVHYEDEKRFLKAHPEIEKNKSSIYKELKNHSLDVIEKKEQVIKNCPEIEYVAPEHFFVHPNIHDIEEQPCIVYEYDKTWKQVKKAENDGFYENVDKVWEEGTVGDPKASFHIIEAIYQFDINGDGIAERGVYIFETARKVMLFASLYPFHHNRCYFIPHRALIKQGCFYGDIPAYRLKPLNVAQNSLLNQAIDSNTIGNVPSFKRRIGIDVPGFVQKWYPGAIFDVRRMDDIEQFAVSGGSTAANLSYFREIDRLSEKLSGVTAYMGGASAFYDPRAPASKTAMLLSEAGISIQDIICILNLSLKEIAFQIIELNRQFGPQEKIFKVVGRIGTFEKISLEEIRGRADYIPQGSIEAVNPDIQRTRNLELYQTLQAEPMIQQNPEAKRELLDALLRSWSDYWAKKADKIVPPLEEFEQRQRELLKQAMQEMAAEQQKARAAQPGVPA